MIWIAEVLIEQKEKEIKELKEQLEKNEGIKRAKDMYIHTLSEDNKRILNDYWNMKKETDQVIKQYLIKKRDLLDEQDAPVPLRELIYNLIQELEK